MGAGKEGKNEERRKGCKYRVKEKGKASGQKSEGVRALKRSERGRQGVKEEER